MFCLSRHMNVDTSFHEIDHTHNQTVDILSGLIYQGTYHYLPHMEGQKQENAFN